MSSLLTNSFYVQYLEIPSCISMLLDFGLEVVLCLRDVHPHDGLRPQLNLHMLQLLQLPRDLMKPLLQYLITQPPNAVHRARTEVHI